MATHNNLAQLFPAGAIVQITTVNGEVTAHTIIYTDAIGIGTPRKFYPWHNVVSVEVPK